MSKSPPRSALSPDLGMGLGLTPREHEIACWLGQDATYSEIGKRLGLKHDTIRTHARNILRKLGVRTRHAAVDRLHRAGVDLLHKGD